MRSLITYLNSLPPGERAALAARCKTTEGYLRKACSVGSVLREKLCAQLELHSGGKVTRQELRPDDWSEVWPELSVSDKKQPPAQGQQAQAATEPVASIPAPGAAERTHA